jgi:4'-phosphopantetheinyl transferase
MARKFGMLRTQPTCVTGEVHLWRIELDCAAPSVAALESTLGAGELERAARFRSRELCERWTVARGALRCILATYFQSEPSSLVLRAGPYGKPMLVWPAENISFNLSHTGDLMLLAIAGNGRVGVDAEIICPGIEVADLSRRFFAPVEADEILGLPPEAQLAAFFACWTRKEAFVKALGAGLSVPLDRFRVSGRADHPARLMSVDWGESGLWTLLDVGEPGIAATLAVEGRSPVLRRLEFTPPSA